MEIEIHNIRYTYREVCVKQMVKHLLTDHSGESKKITLLQFSDKAFDLNKMQYLKHSSESVHKLNRQVREAVAFLESQTPLKVTGEIT